MSVPSKDKINWTADVYKKHSQIHGCVGSQDSTGRNYNDAKCQRMYIHTLSKYTDEGFPSFLQGKKMHFANLET